MLKGERQMKLAEAVRVAAFLGVPQEDVLRHAGAETAPPPQTSPPRRGRPRRAPTWPSAPPSSLEPIPIRGASSIGDELVLAELPVGQAARPPNLSGVRDAYAIYMVGDVMQPRYEQGWLLNVNPFKPPTTGRDVVVVKQGNAALISQFVRWDGNELVLRQLNPPHEFRIPREEVLSCHLIVGVDQEG
jgi:hypothetical protein